MVGCRVEGRSIEVSLAMKSSDAAACPVVSSTSKGEPMN